MFIKIKKIHIFYDTEILLFVMSSKATAARGFYMTGGLMFIAVFSVTKIKTDTNFMVDTIISQEVIFNSQFC